MFAKVFEPWSIRLPDDDVRERRRGKINEAGWTIWYLFGSDEKGEYLDYYATHRMTSDSHTRIREDGTVEALPELEEMYIGSADPLEDAIRQAEYLRRNRKVARMLEEKGFGLSGDEPLSNQVRRIQMAPAETDEASGDEPSGRLGSMSVISAQQDARNRQVVEGTPEMGLFDLQSSYRLAQKRRFDEALDALPAPPLGKGNSNWAEFRLTLKLLVRDPVDAFDLLALFTTRLTKVGKEHVREVAQAVDVLLEKRRAESGRLILDVLVAEAEDYEWRDWDLAYLNGAYGKPGKTVVQTLSFGANDRFRDLAYSLIREAEDLVRQEHGLPPVRKRKTRRPRKVSKSPVALKGFVSEESLPLPHVHYPGLYGTFLAFSETKDSQPFLCSCAESAVVNLIDLVNQSPVLLAGRGSVFEYVFRDHFFPEQIVDMASKRTAEGIGALPFRDRICHRCNLVSPKLRYCHEMYGTVFLQHHGWYVNQSHLRFGVLRQEFGEALFPYLQSECPPEIASRIERARVDQTMFLQEEQRLLQMAQGPDRDDISPNEATYWRNVKFEEAKPMERLRQQAAQSKRAVSTFFENIAREEFGFRKVGERWVSETLLFQIADRVFESEDVIHHHRPEWLGGLELDIYVPSRKLAFEYQGEQHFHPIEIWGGEAALEETRIRDERKRSLCADLGVTLVEVDYTEPLTESHVRRRISEAEG